MIRVHFQVGEKQRLTAGFVTTAIGLDSYKDRIDLGQRFGIVTLQDPAFSGGIVLVENAQVNGLLPVRSSSSPRLKGACPLQFGLLVEIVGVKDE